MQTFHGHTEWVRCVAFAGHGRRILSGSEDKTLRLWEIGTEKELHTFEGHKYSVNCCALFPGHRQALSGSADETLRIWDLP